MRILGLMIVLLFLSMRLGEASTINLNDGRTVQGDIIKQDTKSVQINVDGVTMTYYKDEIKDIDGNPFGSAGVSPDNSAAASPAPAAVQAPEPAAPAAATPSEAAAPQSATQSQGIDPDKKVLILKFIDVFGTRQALTNNFEMMLKQFEKEKPEEAQKIRQRVKVDEIIDRLLPVYDRNFSSDDLKAFIAFYASPEGQKLITTIPELMKESVQESIKYMEEKFPEVQNGQK